MCTYCTIRYANQQGGQARLEGGHRSPCREMSGRTATEVVERARVEPQHLRLASDAGLTLDTTLTIGLLTHHTDGQPDELTKLSKKKRYSILKVVKYALHHAVNIVKNLVKYAGLLVERLMAHA